MQSTGIGRLEFGVGEIYLKLLGPWASLRSPDYVTQQLELIQSYFVALRCFTSPRPHRFVTCAFNPRLHGSPCGTNISY